MLLDDHLLLKELIVGLPAVHPTHRVHTTTYWYYRACRAGALGSNGKLSSAFGAVPPDRQLRALSALLRLREDIGLPDPRSVVPSMVELAERHPRLNLLNLEAAAAARELGATVWLSEPAASGILPSVLDAERVDWKVVALV